MDDVVLHALLERYDVKGASIAITRPASPWSVETLTAGRATADRPMTKESWVQYASLSKTLATAFALEEFRKRSWDPTTKKVNDVLRDLDSSLLLEGPWAEEVALSQLCNHTALGMHYVPGTAKELPSAEDILQGKCGYSKLVVDRVPGERFAYSGGGFVVLEHVLELLVDDLPKELNDWLAALGAPHVGFGHYVCDDSADGFYDHGRVPCRGGFAFPAFAAGCRGRCDSLAHFLAHLVAAYQGLDGSLISQETARLMIDDTVDLGAKDFMNARAGLGVFVATAGPNRLLLHQAANDGFRGLYVICADGPDLWKGFVVVANGDNPAVFLNSDVAVLLAKRVLKLQGCDFDRLPHDCDLADFPQEQIVNMGYKQLVFEAFLDEQKN